MLDCSELSFQQMADIVRSIHLELKRRNPIGVNAYTAALNQAAWDLEEIHEAELENPTCECGPGVNIYYEFKTIKEARKRAERGTKWLSSCGCNQILMVNTSTREVEVPSDIANTWPGICDLMTE